MESDLNTPKKTGKKNPFCNKALLKESLSSTSTATVPMSILEVREVYKYFGGLKALNGVSLKIEEGTITGLVGPNGSGKTTLFNVITGMLRPDGGKIYFMGDRIDNLPPFEIYRRGVARSYQFPRIFQKMTLLDNLIVAAKSQLGDNILYATFRRGKFLPQEAEIKSRAVELLEFLDLGHLKDTYPTEISGGQLKLLEIGRALMAEPKLLLLDEPAAGLNPVSAARVYDKIRELRDTFGLTPFIIEHRFELMQEYAEEVFVMHKGEVVCRGKPTEVAKTSLVIKIYLGEA
jgi:branched-chain amino acid transport system ATP-binding protein